MTTNGDIIVVIEHLLSKGLITEKRNEKGEIVYGFKKILDGMLIRCMDCNLAFLIMEDSIKHQEKTGHLKSVNMYKRNQSELILKEIIKNQL